jgi:hypothetical protein
MHQTCPANRKEAGPLVRRQTVRTRAGWRSKDRELRQRFELRAAAMNVDALTIRGAVMEFIVPPRGEYLDHDGAYRYANEIYKAVAAIDDLIQAGGGADAIVIAREAIGWLTGPYDFVDDSSGSVADAAYELLAVHLRACAAAPPEPVSLGGYLAGLLLDNGCELYRTTIGSLKVRTGDDNYRRIASLLLSARACHLALMKILNQNGL